MATGAALVPASVVVDFALTGLSVGPGGAPRCPPTRPSRSGSGRTRRAPRPRSARSRPRLLVLADRRDLRGGERLRLGDGRIHQRLARVLAGLAQRNLALHLHRLSLLRLLPLRLGARQADRGSPRGGQRVDDLVVLLAA